MRPSWSGRRLYLDIIAISLTTLNKFSSGVQQIPQATKKKLDEFYSSLFESCKIGARPSLLEPSKNNIEYLEISWQQATR